jgi:hypothetical protein
VLLVCGVQGGPRDPEPDLAHIRLASLEAGTLRQVLRTEAFNQAAYASTAGPRTRSISVVPAPIGHVTSNQLAEAAGIFARVMKAAGSRC